MVEKRRETEFITSVPKESGRVVAMIAHKGQVFLACEHHIYQLSNDKVFKKIQFEEVKDGCPI